MFDSLSTLTILLLMSPYIVAALLGGIATTFIIVKVVRLIRRGS